MLVHQSGVKTLVSSGLVLGLFAALMGSAQAQRGPARVQVDPVSVVEVAETQPIIARLVSIDESVVATRIPGIVGEVYVKVGDRVEAGDPLAKLDTELLLIELEGAQAVLTQADAGLQVAAANEDLAEQVFQRTERLRGSAAYSAGRADDLAQELARTTAELARAEAALAVSMAQVQSARYRMTNSVVRAPFPGVVLARSANPGDYLTVGGPVARVMDDLNLEIEADVPSEMVAALSVGDKVSIVMDDGAPGLATVRALVPAESQSTRTRPVRFTIDTTDSDKPLASGQTVTVLAPVGPARDVLSVAKDALVQQVGGWIVYAAVEDRATPRPVTLGTAIADRFEVRGNLQPGDLVVVRGNERLRPGQPIAFEDPGGSVVSGSASTPGTQAAAQSGAEATQ
ncbi:MAG: efflux RND transporter periplasmic adaptor subunit [Pseudomonadota bacterium]